jgi:hypothetical protein
LLCHHEDCHINNSGRPRAAVSCMHTHASTCSRNASDEWRSGLLCHLQDCCIRNTGWARAAVTACAREADVICQIWHMRSMQASVSSANFWHRAPELNDCMKRYLFSHAWKLMHRRLSASDAHSLCFATNQTQ